MKRTTLLLTTLTALVLPLSAFAQTGFPTPDASGLQAYTDAAINFINGFLVYLLGAIAVIVFLYGVANAYILHPDNEEMRQKGHQYILWGIIGFVIIFALWGIIGLVAGTLGLTAGGKVPNYPTL